MSERNRRFNSDSTRSEARFSLPASTSQGRGSQQQRRSDRDQPTHRACGRGRAGGGERSATTVASSVATSKAGSTAVSSISLASASPPASSASKRSSTAAS